MVFPIGLLRNASLKVFLVFKISLYKQIKYEIILMCITLYLHFFFVEINLKNMDVVRLL